MTLPAGEFDSAAALVAETGTTLTAIGQVAEAEEPAGTVRITDAEGQDLEASGFDHMRGSGPG